MLTKKHRSDADRKFGNPAEHFGALDANSAQRLALAAGDIALRAAWCGLRASGSAPRRRGA